MEAALDVSSFLLACPLPARTRRSNDDSRNAKRINYTNCTIFRQRFLEKARTKRERERTKTMIRIGGRVRGNINVVIPLFN